MTIAQSPPIRLCDRRSQTKLREEVSKVVEVEAAGVTVGGQPECSPPVEKGSRAQGGQHECSALANGLDPRRKCTGQARQRQDGCQDHRHQSKPLLRVHRGCPEEVDQYRLIQVIGRS
jgi:hypothetical protein